MLRAFIELKQREMEITMEGLMAEVERILGAAATNGKGKEREDVADDPPSEEDVLRSLRDGDLVRIQVTVFVFEDVC